MDVVDGIEFINTDSRVPSSLIGLNTKPPAPKDNLVNPQPTHDFYHDRFSFPILVYSTLFGAAVTSSLLLLALRTQDIRPTDIVSPTFNASFRFFLVPPLPILLGYLGFCVVLSLLCEIRIENKIYRRWCRFLQWLLYTSMLVLPSFSYTFLYFLAMICAALYLVLSVVHGVRRYKARKKEVLATHNTWSSSSCAELDSMNFSRQNTDSDTKEGVKMSIAIGSSPISTRRPQ